jgi:hypothetical protein
MALLQAISQYARQRLRHKRQYIIHQHSTHHNARFKPGHQQIHATDAQPIHQEVHSRTDTYQLTIFTHSAAKLAKKELCLRIFFVIFLHLLKKVVSL